MTMIKDTTTVGEIGAIMRAFEQAFVDAQLIEHIDPPTRERHEARRTMLTDAFAAKVELPAGIIDERGLRHVVQVDYVDKKLRGFCLRASSTGAKVWMLRYRTAHERTTRRLTLGRVGEMTAADARKEARDKLADIHKGSNPAQERRDERNAILFGELVKQYLDEHAKALKSVRNYTNIIKREFLPKWRNRSAKDITSTECYEALRDILTRGVDKRRESAAVYAQAVLSGLFTFACAQERHPALRLAVNPMNGLRQIANPKAPKEVLNPEQIKALWTALDEVKSVVVADAIKLMLLTGQRPGEVRGMSKAAVSMSESTWLQRETKNTDEHIVHLAPKALAIVEHWFSTGATKPFARGLKSVLSMLRERVGVHFELRWLRRTATTEWAKLEILPHVQDRMLNHRPKGITDRHYNANSYARECAAAWNRWDRRLTEIVTGHPAPSLRVVA
jgi:integrase